MRISVLHDDPGYANWRGQKVDVYLDGKKVKDCITVDTDQGFVVCMARDELGRLRIDTVLGRCHEVTLFGLVSVDMDHLTATVLG